MNRFLRLPEVIRVTGLSSTSIWRWEKAGNFPRKVRLGSRSVAWKSDEIAAWLESREPVETPDE